MDKVKSMRYSKGKVVLVVILVVCFVFCLTICNVSDGVRGLLISGAASIMLLATTIPLGVFIAMSLKDNIREKGKFPFAFLFFCSWIVILFIVGLMAGKNLALDLIQGPATFNLDECRLEYHEDKYVGNHMYGDGYWLKGKDDNGNEYSFEIDDKRYKDVLKKSGLKGLTGKLSEYGLPDMEVTCYKNSEVLISYEVEPFEVDGAGK